MNSNQNLKSFSEFEKIWEAEVNYEEGAPKADQEKINALELKIKEYWGLSTDINSIQKEIDAIIEEKMGALKVKKAAAIKEIENSMAELKMKKIKTDKAVATFTKAREQDNPEYKIYWEAALTKVNDATRKVLESLKDELMTKKNIPSKLTFSQPKESLNVNEGIIDIIKGAIKKGADYFLNLIQTGLNKAKNHLPELQKATDELENINQQIAGHEEKEADREIPAWQASQYEAAKPKIKKLSNKNKFVEVKKKEDFKKKFAAKKKPSLNPKSGAMGKSIK